MPNTLRKPKQAQDYTPVPQWHIDRVRPIAEGVMSGKIKTKPFDEVFDDVLGKIEDDTEA